MTDKERVQYPCIPLRDVNVLPHTIVHFDIGRRKSIGSLEKAMEGDNLLCLVTQRDDSVIMPVASDLYDVGTIVQVKQMIKISNDVIRVLVEGLDKALIHKYIDLDDYALADVTVIDENVDSLGLSVEEKALINLIHTKFMEYSGITGRVSDETVDSVVGTDEPTAAINKMITSLAIHYSKKQELYEMEPFAEKLELLLKIISEELAVAKEEKILAQKVKEKLDYSQKEYFLREKMKAIQSELSEVGLSESEEEQWVEGIKAIGFEPQVEQRLLKEIERYGQMAPSSPESYVIRNYIETVLALPWKNATKVNSNLNKAEKILNKDHYGMDKIKERILEYLAVIHLSKSLKGPILCFVGPPGVGKTSIAKSIATATGRKFVRMSLGGVRDEAEIRGHRRTYIGSMPGSIINHIKNAGSNNPVFLLDEIDKLGSDYKGDPSSALLEVLDPEQNKAFVDHYMEMPFDLSNVLFVTTANSVDTIPRPLLDRMEVIEVGGYTEEEKVKIAEKYLVPKNLQSHGMKLENLKISESAIRDIINYYTKESGVRNLEREIAALCRKTARQMVTTKKKKYSITPRNLEKYLGKKRYRYDKTNALPIVGTVTGMAWTQVGGDTLSVEAAIMSGNGKIQLTGRLGDVMKESAQTAISYIRMEANTLGVKEDFQKDKDIHIHVPEGAVPKDGPSAGVTMFTAVLSALTNKPVSQEIAMTGEITLRGRVLPVGGIKEKVLAAHRSGVKKILLPEENLKDLEEIPAYVRRELEFVPLKTAMDLLEHVFVEGEVK